MVMPLRFSRRAFLSASATVTVVCLPSCRQKSLPISRCWRFFTAHEASVLAALCDQIVPPDDLPGAVWAGAMEFIDRHDWLKRSALVRWAYHRAFFAMGQAALDGGLPRYYDPEYEGWDQFREAVHELVLFTREQRTALTFALVPIPEGYDDYPYLEYHELVTRFLTQEHRIPTYDLLNAVRGIDARKHWVHPSDGHPDAFVHEQMGIYMDEIMPWGRWIAEAAGRP